MKSFRAKPVGWRGESHRHYLAAKGIKTAPKKYFGVYVYRESDGGKHRGDETNNEVRRAYGMSSIPAGNRRMTEHEQQEYADKILEEEGNDVKEIRVTDGDDFMLSRFNEGKWEYDDGGQTVEEARNVQGTINFTPESVKEFEKAQKKAKEEGKSQFEWEGHVMLTDYAGYLVQYLKSQGL